MVSDWNCLKNIFAWFLYCNHQVHRNLLIALYKTFVQTSEKVNPQQLPHPIVHKYLLTCKFYSFSFFSIKQFKRSVLYIPFIAIK
jgi:hypothetical protein